MKKLYSFLFAATCYLHSSAQNTPAIPMQNEPVIKGNYQLAARFSPKRLTKMVFSTSADPHWLKTSDRFWYMFETSNGKRWYLVDPASRKQELMFDNAKLASAVTMIVRDPFDAQ